MYGEIFLKFPYSTNTTALICKSRKESPQKLFEIRRSAKASEKGGLLKLVLKGNS